MSEGPRKRMAGGQLTRDDDGEGRADDEFLTTPQVAGESEMASRRVVRVRRTGEASSSTLFAGTSSLFKDVALVNDKEPPTFKVAFGAGSVATGAAVGGSPAALASSSTRPTPSSGVSPATVPTAFSFGGNTTTSANTESSKAPATSFSFEASPAEGGSGPTKMSSSFSFESATAPSGTASKPAERFNFSFGSAKTPSTTQADEAPSKESVPAVSTATAQPKIAVFGAGSFNFGSAVNSFVEARKKIQEEKKDKAPDSGCAGDVDDDEAPKDDADGTGFGSEIVEQAARNVLATAPSKLFLFKKGEGDAPGRWVERGVGEAKFIAEEKPAEAGAYVHRLLVRGGYALNATVGKNLFTLCKTEAKHLILAVATGEGPHSYLLKFTGPNAEANTRKFSEAIQQILQKVDKSD